MTDESLVTVYIPTRNRPLLLDRAVRSVLQQDHRCLELIIVDDASDHPVKNTWQDGRVRILYNHEPLGAPASRNKAILAAQGEFITGLDDDDFFLSHRLSSFLKAWRRIDPPSFPLPCAGLFDSTLVLRRGVANPVIRNKAKIVGYEELKRMGTLGSQIFTLSSRLQDSGGFDTTMPAWQDLELWCRFSRAYGFFYNIEASSMVVDESHGAPRISESNSHAVRLALDIFVSRLGLSSAHEVSHPLVFALYYHSFKPRITDVTTLLSARRYRQALRMLVRMMRPVR